MWNWGAHSARMGVFLSVVALGACSLLAPASRDVIVPQTDARSYRYVELDNRMKVLLVSDPTADKAAAALDVHVGSRQDPVDRQGLAHFLEHMLFLGTERYPEAGEYQSFITAHGGQHNAYTSFEHTNYFFDVSAGHLDAALDRFAPFFSSPLFNPEYVQREINAVDSEFRARIKNDQRRLLDVVKEVTNPEHPFSKFTVGSLSTLLGGRGEQALRQDLLDFYEKYYSANRMSLVVIGREPLDELEEMVRPRFERVVDRRVALDPIDVPLLEDSPQWVNIKPEQERRELSLSFPIPAVDPHYRSKPMHYIGNILGHEGEGSLLSRLKARGWAVALSAGTQFDYQGGAVFDVEIRLTEEGAAHTDEIVEWVFRNVAMIRDGGIQQWRFREQRDIGEQQFRFRTRPDEIRESSHLATNMHKYAPQDIIRGPYLMTDYDEALIRDFLDHLRPDNLLVTLTVPGMEGEQTSEIYGVPYTRRALAAETVARWRSPAEVAGMTLPERNDFIAEDFSLKRADLQSAYPQRLADTGRVRVWFEHDDTYELPKGNLHLLVRSPRAGDTAVHSARTDLWEQLVSDQLNEFVYPAQLAGLDFDIRSTWRGLELVINGFDDKQALLLEELAATLGSPERDRQRFERVKKERLRQLENQRQEEPYRLMTSEMPRVLMRYRWPLEALIDATRAADFEAVMDHVQSVMQATELTMQVYGNYTVEDARAFARIAERYLQSSELPAEQPEMIAKLSPGERWHAIDSDHEDAGLMYYLQAPEVSKPARVAMGLAAQMMSAGFYHELRTENQYGYIVTAGAYPLREVPGLIMLVQSPVADTRTLQGAIDGFLQDWQDRDALAAQYERHRAALIQRLAESPSNQWEQGQRYWQDLLDDYTAFDSREQLIAALRAMSFDDWYRRIERYFDPRERRGFWLQVGGRRGIQDLAGERVESVPAFKEKQGYYRF